MLKKKKKELHVSANAALPFSDEIYCLLNSIYAFQHQVSESLQKSHIIVGTKRIDIPIINPVENASI